MKLIKKTWIRIVISLFAGSLTVEFIKLSSDKLNRPEYPMLLLFFALIIFIVLTLFVKKANKNTL
jgi:type II secretory pathway component PulF